jgi:CheY-like chemotaxis protein
MGPQKPTVYVVDDEKVIAETLAMILRQAGFAAFAFQDPIKALDAAEVTSPPSLLIADIVMPGMSGIELAIHFRQSYPHCKVLLFSGQAATADLLDAARRQGYDFEVLAKPIHPADLIARLRACSQNGFEQQTQSHVASRSPVSR